MGGTQNEEFQVNADLHQGCVLSPLLFSLYINEVVSRLREDSCGVECGGDTIPGLLSAEDTTLLASDEEELRKSLDVAVV